MRGGAYRGSADDSFDVRRRAQLECSHALVRRLVRPLARKGVRTRFFLTVYSNVNASLVEQLAAPYSAHLATVTTLSARASEQITATANALEAFMKHCDDYRESFDAVLLTRFDLYFKSDLSVLLGDLEVCLPGVVQG